jgi:hypothetical protein
MFTTVCSIHFMDLENTQPYKPQIGQGGWRTTIRFPAQKRGEYCVVRVPPFFQNTHMSADNSMDVPYSSLEWAQSIVESFTTNHLHSEVGSPGVFICEGPEPTSAELAAAEARQARWARVLVLEAQDLWAAGQKLDVSDLHRGAATWLGDTNYEWMRPPQDLKMVPCSMCGRLVESSVLSCPYCENVMDYSRWVQIHLQKAELQEMLNKAKREKGLPVGDLFSSPPPPPPKKG